MGSISTKPRPFGLHCTVSVFPILASFTFERKVTEEVRVALVEASNMPCLCEAADTCVLAVMI
jgi:hypothetical protein